MALIALGVAAVGGAFYTAVEQRAAAKDQARQQAEAARLAATQAAETSRANALAAQTAAERERVQMQAKANVALATPNATPEVQVATQAPTEALRRRTVRASFTADGGAADGTGSIRV